MGVALRFCLHHAVTIQFCWGELTPLFSYPFDMNGKKHNFFGGQRPLILLLQMRRHRFRTLPRFGVVIFHRAVQRDVVIFHHRARQHPLGEKLQVGDETLIAQRLLFLVQLQLILHQLQDLLHHPGHVHDLRHFAVELRRHQMQGDKSGFILRQRHA